MSEDLLRRYAPNLLVPEPRVDVTDLQTAADSAGKWPKEAIDQTFTPANEQWEENADDAAKQAGAPHTGVMVAFYPTGEQAQELAIEDGEDPSELHLTLAYLGEVGAEIQPADEATLIRAVTAWAAQQEPVKADTNGHGIFANLQPVTYANIDAPALPAARQKLVEKLQQAGLPANGEHGYTPHMTLAYAERRDVTVPQIQMLFDAVVIAFAGNQTVIPLGGGLPEVASAMTGVFESPAPFTFMGTGNTYTFTTNGNPTTPRFYTSPAAIDMTAPPATTSAPAIDTTTAKAFTTEINGRTLISGPAVAIKASLRDPSVEDITSGHMLYMQGKFVGADVPNRNGALWSAGDLELSKGTVTNGPLNWLHEARHVIGTLTKASYVDAVTDHQIAGDTVQPHINATAAIWKWIYPDEAYVIQQASDQKQLWYSMECISKEVACAGPDGCGNITTYAQYMAGAACAHVTQRASVRQFKNPVFLGGAVIVPPSRPGWAEADARVMNTANALAEAAFEQAGKPDVTASQWEQLMAQLVKFAQK